METKQLAQQIIEWRHYLHSIPETAFDLSLTPDFVAATLEEMGIEVHRGIGKTGLVGVIKKGNSNRSIGLRADMDALNIKETTGLPYASVHEGKMHACGHDGHTATLLGAAKLLKDHYTFDGTVYLVFQPDEENGKGARAMIADGLFDRFPMDEIYGIHNMPGMEVGTFHTRVGEFMASEDNFIIGIKGKACHAARPNTGHDSLVIAAEIILALQTIVSRNLDPALSAVISCTEIHTDGLRNVIPGYVEIKGDTRSFTPEVQTLIKERMEKISRSICSMYEAECEFTYTNEFAPTFNTEPHRDYAVLAAKKVFSLENINGDCLRMLGSEDFGAFLQEIPGCYAFIGNGVESEGKGHVPLHNSEYDYNDDILEPGARYFAELINLRLNG